jgi:hypothetical protein
MDIVERATEILRHPENEWAAVEQDGSSMQDLTLGYVAPLVAIPTVAGFLGTIVVGFPGYKVSLIAAFFHAVIGYVIDVIAVYALAHLLTWLAPRFGAKRDLPAAFRVAVYSFTPVWVCGIVGLVPSLGLLMLAGYGYAIYLMTMGAERILGAPKDKTMPYAGLAVGAIFAGLVILHHLLTAVGGAPRLL